MLSKLSNNNKVKEYFSGNKNDNILFGPSFINQNNQICSQKCCFTGWKTDVQLTDNNVKDSDVGTKYFTSNINCNNGVQDTGCLCIDTKIPIKNKECNI